MGRGRLGLVVALVFAAVLPSGQARHLAAGAVVFAALVMIWRATAALERRSRSWSLTVAGISIAGIAHIGDRLAGLYPESVARFYELGYGVGYLAMVVGFIGIARGRALDRWAALSATLEAVAFGAACMMLSWLLVIEQAEPDSTLDTVVASGYPLADVVLMVVILRIVLADPRAVAAWWFLASAAVVLAGDLSYLTGATPAVASIGWVATYVAFALAATHPSLPELFCPASARSDGPAQLWTIAPAVVALASVPLFASLGWEVTLPVAVLASAVALALVARLATLLADHRSATGELEAMASHDTLTGLHNRRHLYEYFAHPHSAEAHQRFLLFIDLDHFKAVNDQHGHAAGDRVLEVCANRLRRAVREADLVWRWAGDEFIALCSGSSDHSEVVATRIIDTLAQPIAFEDLELVISASVGVVSFDPTRPLDHQIADADRAMYRVKVRDQGSR